MKNELTALDVHYLVRELNELLIDAKVDRIYHPRKEEVILRFHITGVGRKILRVVLPGMFYATEHKGDMPSKPTGFCMFMRKTLESGRVRSITQVDFERIVEFVIEKRDAVYHIYLELITPGNFVVCKDEKIMVPLYLKRWKDRDVLPGKPYIRPQKEHNAKTANEVTLRQLLGAHDKSIVKILAVELGLGGRYAEEVCLRASIDKNATEITAEQTVQVLDAVKEILNQKGCAYHILDGDTVKDIVPFDMQFYATAQKKEFATFGSALDAVFTDKQVNESDKTVTSKHDKQIEKTQRIVDQQKQQLTSVEEAITLNQRRGELIYENYQQVEAILNQLQEAKKTMSWKEIKSKLKDHAIIKQINEKQGTLTIELGD